MAATSPSARDSLRQRLWTLVGALMSLNDPNWGRRPGGSNQGPPDLEELWRNFNRKLESLFGRRAPGGARDHDQDVRLHAPQCPGRRGCAATRGRTGLAGALAGF